MRTFLIFLFVAVVSLIVYNPEMDDFHKYLETAAEKEQLDQQTSIINQMFTQDTAKPGSSKPVSHTERNNFFVFSTYKIATSEEDQLLPPEEAKYIGIANMFFEMGAQSPSDTQAMKP